MHYYNHIIETIGNTPLVRHNKVTKGIPGTILVKVEYFNPGNSVKDRIALRMIEDAEAAGILKPGGTVLATVPGISRILRDQADKESDCWRFTEFSAKRLFAECFANDVTIETYGNVLAAIAFMEGLATFELRKEELDYRDQDFQIVIAIHATK